MRRNWPRLSQKEGIAAQRATDLNPGTLEAADFSGRLLEIKRDGNGRQFPFLHRTDRSLLHESCQLGRQSGTLQIVTASEVQVLAYVVM